MRILGIDPGVAIVGYAVVNMSGSVVEIVDYGSIQTAQEKLHVDRLCEVGRDIQHVVSTYSPDELSIERLFFSKNVKTALAVAEARGVLLERVRSLGVDVFEYSPQEVKIALTSHGLSTKRQVQEMVMKVFDLKEMPQPDDVADALAIAYCHAVSRKLLLV
jgi:crossover junction endodeoxyribonuclease RuvC